MKAEKARLFGDEEVRTQILSAATPMVSKQLGKQVKNFNEEMWRASRFEFVVEGNYAYL